MINIPYIVAEGGSPVFGVFMGIRDLLRILYSASFRIFSDTPAGGSGDCSLIRPWSTVVLNFSGLNLSLSIFVCSELFIVADYPLI